MNIVPAPEHLRKLFKRASEWIEQNAYDKQQGTDAFGPFSITGAIEAASSEPGYEAMDVMRNILEVSNLRLWEENADFTKEEAIKVLCRFAGEKE